MVWFDIRSEGFTPYRPSTPHHYWIGLRWVYSVEHSSRCQNHFALPDREYTASHIYEPTWSGTWQWLIQGFHNHQLLKIALMIGSVEHIDPTLANTSWEETHAYICIRHCKIGQSKQIHVRSVVSMPTVGWQFRQAFNQELRQA